MTEAESLYFDLTRVCAALFVLVGHAVIFFPDVMPVRDYGHFAVDAFFVLSGYVIANVADTKERTLHRYVVSRTARIFSVALPAIILTLICDWIGRHGNGAALYNPYPGSQPLVRIGAAATFTSELWFESIQLFSNGPYWSLCYEVWYYAIFAAATYLSGSRRWLLAALLAIIAGPKIMVMFPIWLIGVALYHFKPRLPLVPAILLFIASIASLVLLLRSHVPLMVTDEMRDLFGNRWFSLFEYSHAFPLDYGVGLIFALNYFSVRSFNGTYLKWRPLKISTRWMAASTFSLYLFHRPILQMLLSIISGTRDLPFVLTAIVLTIAAVIVLSYFTERKKQTWRNAMEILFRSRKAVPVPAP